MTPAEVARDFYRRFHDDQRSGRVLTLAEYQALWPGFADVIAEEHERVSGAASSAWNESEGALGPYRDLQEIGRGGQGVVYKAEDTRLGRTVALKILKGLGPDSGHLLKRFKREAEVAAKLDHPGICGVLDAGVIRGTPFIAMQYIEGEALSRKISAATEAEASEITIRVPRRITASAVEGGPASGDDSSKSSSGPTDRIGILHIVQLIEKAARALHAAHEAGVVHRDIKPGNLMVTPEGELVILDFGMARAEGNDLQALTQTGEMFGTPAYMSPEQLTRQTIRIDRRTDIYSLGVTLFECLTCQRPFKAPTREALYQEIMWKDAPDVLALNPSVPRDLRTVLEKSIEKNRDRRYETAQDFAEELRRIREHEPIHARPITRWIKVKRWAQRNPRVAASLLLALLSLSSGLAASLVANRRTQDERDAKEIERQRAETERANVLRLSAFQRLADLEKRAGEDLWPLGPKRASLCEKWLEDAQKLVAGLEPPGHYEQLDALRGRALPQAAEESEVSSLKSEVSRRRTYVFEREEDGWWYSQLLKLTESLERFQDERAGLMGHGVSPEFGWGVARRLAHLRMARDRLLSDAEAWKESLDRVVTNPKYEGLELVAQFGLVPLGVDPASGLEEYGHLATGEVPQRDPKNGRLVLTDETGLVFVLMPGGSFWMGAQRQDRKGGNYNPQALPDQGPVHRVTLSTFFLSKYEMTQGQWQRVTSRNPSRFDPSSREFQNHGTLLHPVEQVSWVDCERELSRLGLLLPTEAQWEYGCRAGTDAASPEGMEGGLMLNQAVGSLAANGFGLHDVHENVMEWCRDGFFGYETKPRPDDGLRGEEPARGRVYRGSFLSLSAGFRQAEWRNSRAPEYRLGHLGVRPSRSVVTE